MNTLNPTQIQEVNAYIDDNHEGFSRLGHACFKAFNDKANNRISSQVRKLQQMAMSAPHLADIEDFIKNQMGKEEGIQTPWRDFGPQVLRQLHALRSKSRDFSEAPEEQDQLAIRLRLARGCIRALVSEYLYRVACDQMGGAT